MRSSRNWASLTGGVRACAAQLDASIVQPERKGEMLRSRPSPTDHSFSNGGRTRRSDFHQHPQLWALRAGAPSAGAQSAGCRKCGWPESGGPLSGNPTTRIKAPGSRMHPGSGNPGSCVVDPGCWSLDPGSGNPCTWILYPGCGKPGTGTQELGSGIPGLGCGLGETRIGALAARDPGSGIGETWSLDQ